MFISENPKIDPIVIVGIGLRLPGGCNDAESYWDLLVNKKDAQRPIPTERFNVDGFYQESGGAGSLSMKHGYFLDEAVDRFDAAFFSMSQAEVARVDPQQRLLLEVMHEALENAGEVDWRGTDISVYAGSFGQDWMQMQARDSQDGNVYGITGMDDFTLANRVSYELDLRGPSMTVKAGCSSSLIALDLACQSLQRGDCSGALVGASNLLLSPEYFMALDNLGALSSSGSSKTFDANADGYARADAVNAVYVKRLHDALRDGNPIRAVIRSTAVNADGKTVGLTNPSTDAQASLIRRAYKKAGINDPGETPMVECQYVFLNLSLQFLSVFFSRLFIYLLEIVSTCTCDLEKRLLIFIFVQWYRDSDRRPFRGGRRDTGIRWPEFPRYIHRFGQSKLISFSNPSVLQL
jgi:acyl transferase domain-containing protein